jgi:hypothetical protein
VGRASSGHKYRHAGVRRYLEKDDDVAGEEKERESARFDDKRSSGSRSNSGARNDSRACDEESGEACSEEVDGQAGCDNGEKARAESDASS